MYQKKICRIVYIILLLMFLSLPAFASDFLVSKHNNQKYPVVVNDLAVWEDHEGNNPSIFMYNFKTKETQRISSIEGNQYAPHTDGKYVVWIDDNNFVKHIVLYEISSGKSKKISTVSSEKRSPKVDYPYIVWSDYSKNTWEIMLYNIDTGKTMVLAKHNYNFMRDKFDSEGNRRAHYDEQLSIAISGDRVVWTDFRNDNWDLYGMNISDGKEFKVVAAQLDQLAPALEGDLLVYQDYDNYNWDIKLYNFANGQSKIICNAQRDQENPDISGNMVVWQDFRNQRWDIYAYDLNKGLEMPLVTKQRNQTYPSISGSRVLYMDDTLAREDIGITTISGGTAEDLSDIPGLKIVVNGKYLEDASPIRDDGRVLIPVRIVSEALGINVDWDGILRKVTLTGSGKEVILHIDDDQALINGITYPLDCAAKIVDTITYVPVRFVSQAFGANVNWKADEELVEIYW
jgi:TolB protein